jgi:hypothetical protein
VTSLLIDGDERPSYLPPQIARQRAELRGRGDVVAEEDRASRAPVA